MKKLLDILSFTVLSTAVAVSPALAKASVKEASKKGAVTTSSSKADIIAVVGTHPITRADLESRITLILLISHMPVNEQTKASLREQVLKNMIDEIVELETAKKYKVVAKDKEIDATITHMAKDWGMTVDQLKAALKQNNVPFSSMRERVKAQLSWNNFIRGAYTHTIHVNDKDVDSYLDKQKANEAKDQFEVAEIFIRSDGPVGMGDAEKQARNLIQQIKAGAHFKAIAQQFSSSPSASRGGYLGWVTDEHESSSLFKNLEPGSISEPYKTNHGIYVYYLLDKKPAGQPAMGDMLVTIKQAIVPCTEGFANPQEDPLLMSKVEDFSHAKSPADFERIAAQHGVRVETAANKPISNFAPEFRNIPVGKMPRPMLTNEGMVIMMMCEKKPGPKKEERSRDDIKGDLEGERLGQRAILQLSQLLGRTYIKLMNPGEFPTIRYGKNAHDAGKGSSTIVNAPAPSGDTGKNAAAAA